jgi:Ser/Thr protein kinase RdoA (MazF antagonist)
VTIPGGSTAALTAATAAGSAALGVPLADPVPLAGSARSAVLRCREPAGGAVVVKTYPREDDGPGSFAAEAAGLALAGGSGLAPRLLAADAATLTVVMSDLGTAPSLADLLLDGQAPAAARAAGTALVDWAAALGRLAAHGAGRAAEHAGLLAGYGGLPESGYVAMLGERIRDTAERAAVLGVTAPAGLAAELRQLTDLAGSPEHRVFSPGDVCPDNNLVTPAGVRFLDFEAAGYHPVFLDAAYLRMPFSSCWCVFALPAALIGEAEAAYRAGVTRVYPDLADEATWNRGVRLAMAAWTLNSLGSLLTSALAGNEPLTSDGPSPGWRQLLRHRWRVLAAELAVTGELPAVLALVRDLLAATAHWQAPELGLYPALSARPEASPAR